MKQMAKRTSESQWWQQFKNIEYNRKGKSKSFVLVKIADTCPPLDKLSVSIQQQKKAWIMSPIALVSFKNIENVIVGEPRLVSWMIFQGGNYICAIQTSSIPDPPSQNRLSPMCHPVAKLIAYMSSMSFSMSDFSKK
jgi:hypothetical protein